MEKLKKMEADMSSERGTTLEEQAQLPASLAWSVYVEYSKYAVSLEHLRQPNAALRMPAMQRTSYGL